MSDFLDKSIVEGLKAGIRMERYFKFLDDLRESGQTNMFAAPSYLRAEYGMSAADSRVIVMEWMASKEKEPNRG